MIVGSSAPTRSDVSTQCVTKKSDSMKLNNASLILVWVGVILLVVMVTRQLVGSNLRFFCAWRRLSGTISGVFFLAVLFNAARKILQTRYMQTLLQRSRRKNSAPPTSVDDEEESLLRMNQNLPSGDDDSLPPNDYNEVLTDRFRRLSRSISCQWNPNNDKKSKKKRRRDAVHVLSAKDCFVRPDFVEQMTLEEIVALFQYAVQINIPDFDRDSFLLGQTRLVQLMIDALDVAVSVSRGSDAVHALVKLRKEGDTDALYFVGAYRIFAEWRMNRLLPKGYEYTRYAFGVSMSYRDVLPNLAKIELGVHSFLKSHGDATTTFSPISSPTLRQLLEFELRSGVHPKLPHLIEKSVGNGFLWMKRQLHYQIVFWANLLEVSSRFEDSVEATTAAYNEAYRPYYSWALHTMVTNSVTGTPPVETIWEVMVPLMESRLQANTPIQQQQEQSSRERASTGNSEAEFPTLRSLSDISDGDDCSEPGPDQADDTDNEILRELQKLGRHIGERWDDFLRHFQCVAETGRRDGSKNLLVTPSSSRGKECKLHLGGGPLCVVEKPPSRIAPEPKIPIKDKQRPFTERNNCAATTRMNVIERGRDGSAKFVEALRPQLVEFHYLVQELDMDDPRKV